MEKERCMELLNSIVRYVSATGNTGGAVRGLLSMGFAPEELTQEFGFDEGDVQAQCPPGTYPPPIEPPLCFRLYQSVRFNRPVDREKDYISPGGYEVSMRDEGGMVKTVKFDFERSVCEIDKDNPCVVRCMQQYLDHDAFEGSDDITLHMLRNIVSVSDWFIYTDEMGDLVPVGVMDAYFEVLAWTPAGKENFIKIPIDTFMITPSCG